MSSLNVDIRKRLAGMVMDDRALDTRLVRPERYAGCSGLVLVVDPTMIIAPAHY